MNKPLKYVLLGIGTLFGLCFMGTCLAGIGSAVGGKGGGNSAVAPAAAQQPAPAAAQQPAPAAAQQPAPAAAQQPAPAAAQQPAPAAAQQVEIRKLLREYNDNEIRADSTFKGNVIQTTGIVDDVKKDILGSIYVTIGTGKQFEIPQVQCFFDDEHAQKAATLSKRSKVTVRGRVDGLMMNVIIKDCEFVGL